MIIFRRKTRRWTLGWATYIFLASSIAASVIGNWLEIESWTDPLAIVMILAALACALRWQELTTRIGYKISARRNWRMTRRAKTG